MIVQTFMRGPFVKICFRRLHLPNPTVVLSVPSRRRCPFGDVRENVLPRRLSNLQHPEADTLAYKDVPIKTVVFSSSRERPGWVERQAWREAALLSLRVGNPTVFSADIDAIDIVLIDATGPRLPTLDACLAVRLLSPSVPLVCVVEDHDVDTSVAVLKAGADDCLYAGSRSDEIAVRLARLVGNRISAFPHTRDECLRFDGWQLLERRRRLLSPSGAEVPLTAAEFDILVAMSRNPGRVLGRQELLALTHFGLAKPSLRAIDVHISRLRAKTEIDPANPQIIKTVRLGGYVFACSVRRGPIAGR
jgi:two-component system, OmpR family, response regulator